MPHTKAFNKLFGAVKKEYLYEKVPAKYQKRYGKRYDSKEIKSVAIAIAKSKRIPIDKY